MLADIELLEKAFDKQTKLARSGAREANKKAEMIEKSIVHINEGNLLKGMEMHEDERGMLMELGIISLKPGY